MANEMTYDEKLSSNRTETLFIGLMLVFLAFSIWSAWAIAFTALFGLFLFYALNYRILRIHITQETLKLTFGIFSWTVALNNVADRRLDELPALLKYGGAGVHFMMIDHRYRVSFNFLEYPRIVLKLKQKVGLVKDISFSTRKPEEVLRFIQQATAHH